MDPKFTQTPAPTVKDSREKRGGEEKQPLPSRNSLLHASRRMQLVLQRRDSDGDRRCDAGFGGTPCPFWEFKPGESSRIR
jgi:hypothetical protein